MGRPGRPAHPPMVYIPAGWLAGLGQDGLGWGGWHGAGQEERRETKIETEGEETSERGKKERERERERERWQERARDTER